MVIGREVEQRQLLQALEAEESQFIAVYGRRRIGKTYLIRQTYKDKFAFQHAGLAKATKKDQLKEFADSLRRYGLKEVKTLRDWQDAFHRLIDLLEAKPAGKKIVFIDELPWLDTHKSKFLSAFEHFWNGWASSREDIILIVCGSATSWIIKKIVRNRGGLHNRVTRHIYLQPFTLRECRQYADKRHLALGDKDIITAYMAFGGVPYYWSLIDRGEPLTEAFDRLFFAPQAVLQNEFDALYASLFKNAGYYIKIVEALGTIKTGMQRAELLKAAKLTNNATFKTALRELEECNFIRQYKAIGKKTKEAIFQLMDNYTLFYFHFIRDNHTQDAHFWQHTIGQDIQKAWQGLAFERVCLWHVEDIKRALGISGMLTSVSAWSYTPTEEEKKKGAKGAQIDLLIERKDNVLMVCEMKYYKEPVSIDADYAKYIRTRNAILGSQLKVKPAMVNTLIAPYGMINGRNSDVFDKVITLEDLLY